MKRRTALKKMLLASGSSLILPSWSMNWSKEKLPAFDSVFTSYEEQQITALVNTILPTNGTIGGLSVGVHTFLIGLISECYNQQFQVRIKEMLVILDRKSKTELSSEFNLAAQNEREHIFLGFEHGNEEEKDFFNFMKNETIRGFETSEEVLVNYRGYELMPGFYDGDVTTTED